MYLRKENGQNVRINRTRGLSTISVSTKDARPAHDSLINFFDEEVKRASSSKREANASSKSKIKKG